MPLADQASTVAGARRNLSPGRRLPAIRVLLLLTWLMTPLMTVSLFASRQVAELAAQQQEARDRKSTRLNSSH